LKRLPPLYILFSCILLPPVLYVLTLQAMETVAQKRWTYELLEVLVSDSRSLLQGRISIEDEMQRNVDRFLVSRNALKWGILPQIIVKTTNGRRLYPPDTQYMFDSGMFPREKTASTPTEMLRVAERNLTIMDEGFDLLLTVQIPVTSFLANSVLVFYIVVFTFLLYWAYRSSAREATRFELSNRQALETANKNLINAQQRLQDVIIRERSYQQETEKLKKDLDLVSNRVRETEDEALSEMEHLEKSLHESIDLKEELELEVLRLGEELERIESAQKVPPKKRLKQIDGAAKRFKTLYKNLEIQQKAVEGFVNLESNLQLRAEELIHNMNEDSSKLTVKRKLFSKKGADPSFECEFGYKGRIYWRPGPGTKTQVLVIGTKNSQTKDLAYLESQ
jgi:hypothetical protein